QKYFPYGRWHRPGPLHGSPFRQSRRAPLHHWPPDRATQVRLRRNSARRRPPVVPIPPRPGPPLFILARGAEPLKSVCEEIQRAGGTAAFASCDVRDYAAVEAASKTAESQIGEINTLVNNAAGNFMARTEKLTPNAFNAVVSIVLTGSFNCTQVFGKRWIEKKQPGNVVNIVTTYAAANCGSGFVVPSACAKAGVLALTR